MRLVLAKHVGGTPELVRVQARPLEVKGETRISFLYRYRTRDVTVNLPLDQALERIDELLGNEFHQANLLLPAAEVQLSFSKRGKPLLRTMPRAAADPDAGMGGEAAGKAAGEASGRTKHNREKQRLLSLDRPFLQALGVTDDRRELIPSMSRKWKQINRFIEVFAAAWKSSALEPGAAPLRVVDFGSGKGYLTFALHDFLQHTLGIAVQTMGVELRAELVRTCNDAVAGLRIEGLSFVQGDIAGHEARAEPFDVMIALHACDTATDDAIHQAIRAGAAIIMCAPCCHKQLRPQLLTPHPLRPILQHGIHLGQEAEMLTDGLRALLLDAHGYDAQVFEFISLEHTSKNKMILAVRRRTPKAAGPVLAQIREIKSFYGISEQRLESLLFATREERQT